MTITDWLVLAVFANSFVLGIGIVLIRKDVEELKDLINENRVL